jgi:glycosyltransferase involved in cell wall biosynthesis
MDSVTVGSPGNIQLRDELARSVEEYAPEGSNVVLLMSPGHCKVSGSDKLRVVNVEKPGGGWIGRWKWYHRILPQIAREHGIDVLYSLSGILSKRLCESLGVVTTVNNMLPFTPKSRRLYPIFSKTRLRHALLLRVYVRSLRIADTVVLHSQHGLNMVKPYTGDISSKTFVVLTGVPRDLGFKRSEPPLHPYDGKPYFLYFSAIYPYKNHLNLIEAYRIALNSERQLSKLLIAGLPEDKRQLENILTVIRESDLVGKVKYIGVLDRKDIPAWLYFADVNFFPSTCETNSLVLAEILGLGGVLACSNIPPMSEVAGYAAELFDPYLVDSMTDVIIKLSRNRKRCDQLRCLALKRAKEFSWNLCGETIWQAVMKAKAAFQSRRRI